MEKNQENKDTWFTTVYNANILDLCNFFNISLVKEGQALRGIEHDSLVINPDKNMYYWNSRDLRGKGGWSFIKNYVLDDNDNHIPKREFVKQMKDIGNQLIGNVSKFESPTVAEKVQPYIYPKEHIVNNIKDVKNYLVKRRKIDPHLVDWLHANGLLDQDKLDNAVFVERNLFNNKIVGSVLQGTHIDYQKYGKRGTTKIIDKNSEPYSAWHFTIGKPENVRFFESPIDAMSFYQLNSSQNSIFISMNGLKKEIVSKYLTEVDSLLATKYHSGIRTIALGVDNDKAGKQFAATESQYKFRNAQGKIVNIEHATPRKDIGKDWNDVLKAHYSSKVSSKKDTKKGTPQDIAKTPMSDLMKDVHNYFVEPEKTLELLNFLSRFHGYSIRNRMLIAKQREGALAVASFSKYRQMGYSVKKGEKGIKILVPFKKETFIRNKKEIPVKYATEAEKAKIKAGKLLVKQSIRFIHGNVFDVSQTNMPKEKYPEMYPNRHLDFNINNPIDKAKLDQRLDDFAKSLNYKVNRSIAATAFSQNFGNAKGVTAHRAKEIYLNPNNTPTEMTTTLMHELGHAQLHSLSSTKEALPRPLKELQAQMASYLVAENYGIDNHDYTVNYIADWTDNGQKLDQLDPEVQAKILTNTTKAADKMINFIEEQDLKVEMSSKRTEPQHQKKKSMSKSSLATQKKLIQDNGLELL